MGHQKELLSGFSRCFERIFLLLFSFDNPFSHFVGVNGVGGPLWSPALPFYPSCPSICRGEGGGAARGGPLWPPAPGTRATRAAIKAPTPPPPLQNRISSRRILVANYP